MAGLFRCIFCTHGQTSDEKQQLTNIAESLNTIKNRIEVIEQSVNPTDVHVHRHGRRRTTSNGSKDHHLLSSVTEKSGDESEESDSDTSVEPRQERDFLTNPYWIEDQELRKGEVDFLSSSEIQFWKDLIAQYLYPIDNDPVEQVSHFGPENSMSVIVCCFVVKCCTRMRTTTTTTATNIKSNYYSQLWRIQYNYDCGH